MSLPIDSSAVRPTPARALTSTPPRARRCAGLLLACLLPLGCTVLPPEPPATVPTPVATPLPVAPPPLMASAPRPAPPASAATPATPEALAPATAADAAARRLLAFNDRVRELGPADLAREIVRLGEPGDPAATLELAMVLAQTRQNGDLSRALALVEPLARSAVASPWQGLARLLHPRLMEQRRLEELVDRQSQQLREQQRRIDQLANQIDALRAIERSLNTRPPSAAPPANPASPPPR